MDKESEKGRFGWTLMEAGGIPYIFRPDGNYCALRILEHVRFSKMPSYIKKELLSCTTIKYVTATQTELKLLNDINSNHCNFQYGLEQFDNEELLMNITHAVETCKFLRVSCTKLKKNFEFDISNVCGFIRINKESVIPYSVKNDTKCVPLFYFEGEMDYFEKCSFKMEGWDLCYLKFCCKIQGVSNTFLTGESCLVVPLEKLKTFFPKNTTFEMFWPQKAAQQTNVASTLSALFNFDSKLTSENKFPITPKPILPKTSYKRNAYYVGPYHKYSLYSLQKININNRMINSINMKPNDMCDKWVTLEDLSRVYFFNVPVVICQQVLRALDIEICKANAWQNLILQNTGSYSNYDNLNLVKVEEIIKYWLQINFMLKNISTSRLEIVNKK